MGNVPTKIDGRSAAAQPEAYEMDRLSRQAAPDPSPSPSRLTREGPLAGLQPSARRRGDSATQSPRAADADAPTAHRDASRTRRSPSLSSTRGVHRFELASNASASVPASSTASIRSEATSAENASPGEGGHASVPGEPMSALFARLGIAPQQSDFDPYDPNVSFGREDHPSQYIMLCDLLSNGLAHVLYKDKPMFYGQAADVAPLLRAMSQAAGTRALHPDFSLVVSPNWADPDNAMLLLVNKRAFAANVLKEHQAFGFAQPPSEEQIAHIVDVMGTPAALEWLSPELTEKDVNHAAMGLALGMGIDNALAWNARQPVGQIMAMVRELQKALPTPMQGYRPPPQRYYDVPRSGAIANHHFDNAFALNDEMREAYEQAKASHPGLTFQGFAYAHAMARMFPD